MMIANRKLFLATVAMLGASLTAAAAYAQSADESADDLNARQLAMLLSGAAPAGAADAASLPAAGGVDTMEMDLSAETEEAVDSDVEATGEGDMGHDAAEALDDAADARDETADDAEDAAEAAVDENEN